MTLLKILLFNIYFKIYSNIIFICLETAFKVKLIMERKEKNRSCLVKNNLEY